MNWYDISMPLITSELQFSPGEINNWMFINPWWLLAGTQPVYGELTAGLKDEACFSAEKPYLVQHHACSCLKSCGDFLVVPLQQMPRVLKLIHTPFLLLEGLWSSQIMHYIHLLFNLRDNPQQRESILLVQQLIEDQIANYIPPSSPVSVRHPVIEQFKQLVQNNFSKQPNITFYVKELCCSERHLYTLCRRHLQQAPQSYIHEYMLQIILLKIKAGHTFRNITDDLGFKEQNHFSRFVKRYSGHTPQDWRKHYHEQEEMHQMAKPENVLLKIER